MTEPELVSATFDAELAVRSEEERLIDLRLVPYGVVGRTAQGPERIRPGAFRGARAGDVSLEAIGAHGLEPGVRLVGRGVSLDDRQDGLYGTFRVARTRDGDELLELAREGVYRGASVVFEPGSSRVVDGIIERSSGTLRRVGLVERGAYAGAEVLAVRSAAEREDRTMNRETNPPAEPEPEPEPAPPAPEPAYLARAWRVDPSAAIEELRRDLVGRMTALEAGIGQGREPSLLSRYGSLVEYFDAAYNDPDAALLLSRALADNISSESPGVIPPSWATEIAGIIARPRSAIEALGGARSLGDTGLEYDFPYLDPTLNLTTLVGKQTTEKTQIASAKVKILKGSAPIETFSGGSDVALQLIRRSRPAYREAYLRILAIAYGITTEAAFEVALLAAAGDSLVLTATATADQVRAFLFAASSKVKLATGSPATVDLVSSAEFQRLGGLAGLNTPEYGVSNVAGTASAATLRINVNGLPIIEAPTLTGNTHLVTNAEAAGWHEDGPFPISALDVTKLGENVAIWGLGATVVEIPKGVVKSTLT